MIYSVYERFVSFQGEGAFAGTPAYFIRMHGCDQHCSWCDAAGTWHPSYTPPLVLRASDAELVRDALLERQRKPFEFLVITGGEPCLQDLTPLANRFREWGIQVHLETAGHRPIRREDISWITLSPKPKGRPPRLENVAVASELKLIIDEPGAMRQALKCLVGEPPGSGVSTRDLCGRLRDMNDPCRVFLQPEWGWSQRDRLACSQEVLDSLWEARPYIDVRISVQGHKVLLADELDPRSRPAVPLGGGL